MQSKAQEEVGTKAPTRGVGVGSRASASLPGRDGDGAVVGEVRREWSRGVGPRRTEREFRFPAAGAGLERLPSPHPGSIPESMK